MRKNNTQYKADCQEWKV